MTADTFGLIGTRTDADRLRNYIDRAVELFDVAAQQGSERHDIRIGTQHWRLHLAGQQPGTIFLPAFSHVELPGEVHSQPDLTVCIWEGIGTNCPLPFPDWDWENRRAHSVHQSSSDHALYADIHFNGLLTLVDRTRRLAIVWTQDLRTLHPYDISAPLATLIDQWFAPTPFMRIHSGAVGLNGTGILLTGKSGSGKSTATLASLRYGLDYVGDDYVLVDTETAVVYSLYSSAKIALENVRRFPELGAFIREDTRVPDEKAILFVEPMMPGQTAASLQLSAMVVPRVTGQTSSFISEMTSMNALLALAPSTLFQSGNFTQADFLKLSRLVRMLPAFQLHAGTDLAALVECLRQFLDANMIAAR